MKNLECHLVLYFFNCCEVNKLVKWCVHELETKGFLYFAVLIPISSSVKVDGIRLGKTTLWPLSGPMITLKSAGFVMVSPHNLLEENIKM